MKHYILPLLVLLTLQAQAQVRGFCGMTTADQLAMQEKFAEADPSAAVLSRSDVIYLPVTFHLVANTDGRGRINEALVLDQLCAMNKDFEDQDIQFYLKRFNYINNTVVNNDHRNTANTIMTWQRDGSSINIFIVDEIVFDEASEVVTLGYYDTVRDWLVIVKSEVASGSASLSHEIGHFFTLSHPHLGWDAEPWEEGVYPGNRAPALSPGGVPTERVNGSNCNSAGDGLCDTPADYNLGLGWNNCNYNGPAKDPTGASLDPMEENVMGYFLNCPRNSYTFTDQQKQQMEQNLASSARSYIRTGVQPSTAPINQTPILRSPINDEVTSGYESITLDWDDVPNANRYFVEISRLPTFPTTLDPIRLVVGESRAIVEGLELDKRYYWRVRPFSDYITCTEVSDEESFFTGVATSTQAPKALTDWAVSPNPIQAGTALQINITTDKTIEGDIRLFSTSGQLMRSINNEQFPFGTSTIQLTTADLTPGIYFLSFVNENGVLTERVLIQ